MIDRACISLNSRCNLRCVYCHFGDKKNNEYSQANEFTKDDAKIFCTNLYNYIKDNNILYFKLGIVGSGEPLLSFDTLKMIVEYFSKCDLKERIKMYVISNGTLLKREIVDFFYKNKGIIELNISIDGDPELNKKMRGIFPDFSTYKNIFGEMPKINAVVTKEVILNQERVISFFVDSGFKMINFSKVFATDNPNIMVTDDEYKSFLILAKSKGIVCRQNIMEKKYDCAKYGRLCGVGRNNIFFTKTGVYPCGRFMDIKEYVIGEWNEAISNIERSLSKIHPCPDGKCYFEYNKVGK